MKYLVYYYRQANCAIAETTAWCALYK